ADDRLRFAAVIAGRPGRIGVGGVDGAEADAGEPIQNGERGLLVRRPAEHVAAKNQRGDVEVGAAETPKLHETPPLFPIRITQDRLERKLRLADGARPLCDIANVRICKVLVMSDDAIRQARRWFAEELRFIARAGVRDLIDITRRAGASDVIEAFATVPRERFVGPGPLRILSPWNMREYWTPADQTPAAVYHDLLIAYDEQRCLNNGQPSLWAFIFDKLNVVPGEHVLHLGCGMGYYTAILAELVGPTGEVLAIEIDKPLAERAKEARASWPQVTVANGDGADSSFAKCDVV